MVRATRAGPSPSRPWRRQIASAAAPAGAVAPGLPGVHVARPGKRPAPTCACAGLHAASTVLPMFLGTGGHVRKDLPQRCCIERPARHLASDRCAGGSACTAAIGEQPVPCCKAMSRSDRWRCWPMAHEQGSRHMNLHQFRFVQEAVRRNLNLTETAKALFTPRSPASARRSSNSRKNSASTSSRATASACAASPSLANEVLKSIEIIMREVANLKRIGDEFSKQDAGTLSIATTHTQARYFLPLPVAANCAGATRRCRWCCTRACPSRWRACCWTTWPTSAWPPKRCPTIDELVTLPCYEWQHVHGGAAHSTRWPRVERPRWNSWPTRAAGAVPPHRDRPHAHRPGLSHAHG